MTRLSDGDIERMIDNLSHGMHPKVGDRIDIKSALTELQSLRAASVCVETLETLHKTEVSSLREREARLVEALWQLLDDMGDDGLCVCQDAKDQAIAAFASTPKSEGGA